MKKINILGIAALAVLSLAACNKETEFSVPSAKSIIITASREDSGTRTAVQQDGKSVWWSASESISVSYGPSDSPATFTGQNTEPAATAQFKGTLPSATLDESIAEGARYYFGIYPATPANTVSASGEITVELKAAQTALAGTFEDNLFPAVARAEGTSMTFMNVAGGIKFSVGVDDVQSVSFSGNASETLAGIATVAFRDGIPVVQSVTSPATEVVVNAPEGGFVKGKEYYAILLPGKLASGITITMTRTGGDPVVIVSEKAQEVKRGIIGKVGELAEQGPKLTVERLWGKYSTADASWNEYFGGSVNSDRNVAMDDNYIYIAEANKTKNLWALNVADGSLYKALPTSTVKEAGTFYLSCPRVMNLSGEPVLVVCNMTEDASNANAPLYIYVYENGIEAEPAAIKLIYGAGRLGDTFSFWGASATNSADGQGLSRGLLYFDAMFADDGVRIWKTTWSKGSLPTADQSVQVRYKFDNGNIDAAAFWAYPDAKDAGIWGARNYVRNSLYATVAPGAPNLWNATGNQTENTVCTDISSGWYVSVPCYQYFTFNGKRYIAYTRQVDGNDGRLIILEGETTDSWETIMTNHNVVYQAAIQEEAENQSEYNTSPRSSGNQGMDLCIRVKDDGVYLVCVKQNVGLSLFKMSLK